MHFITQLLQEFAMVHAYLGEKDQVFEQSEKAYEEHDPFCLTST